ncbi:MAG: shikimate dehydrogenase, partial [Bacteroidales bacterium]|nr:shikimate dehydrogenase [Bacteroidales bacterium]
MRRYGLIGYPLQHSFSEGYFTNKFRKEKVDAVYNTFPLEAISELPDLLSRYPDIEGLNVTHPYKTSVIDYLDDLDQQAGDVGAVNVIRISREGNSCFLKGFNTDVDGFVLSLKTLLNTRINNALVLGTGGASRAVQKGLDMLAIEYKVVSRKKGKADLAYGDMTADLIRNCRLVINATPLGMFPET